MTFMRLYSYRHIESGCAYIVGRYKFPKEFSSSTEARKSSSFRNV